MEYIYQIKFQHIPDDETSGYGGTVTIVATDVEHAIKRVKKQLVGKVIEYTKYDVEPKETATYTIAKLQILEVIKQGQLSF